jgi:peptidoglycan hydrolase-like protein with peptidoglycan-binding domain
VERHVSTLNKIGSPALARTFLSRLQQDYGNRVVARVVALARQQQASAAAALSGQNPQQQPAPAQNAGDVVRFPDGTIKLTPKVQRFDAAGNHLSQEIEITSPSQNVDLTPPNLTNGEHGSIRFIFDAEWEFGAKHPQTHGLLIPSKGSSRLVTLTPYRVPAETKPDEDKVKFSKTRPTLAFSEGTGGALDKQPFATEDPDDQGGSVTVAPSITFQVQSADQKGVGVSVDLLIFSPQFDGSLQVAVNETQSISRAYTATLRFPLNPQPQPNPPQPNPPQPNPPTPVPPGPKSEFKSKRFTGQSTLEACGRGEHRMLIGEGDHDAVLKVQQTLAEAGFAIDPDGAYGPKTEKAVANFKSTHKPPIVPSDGVVGPQTSHALDEIAASRGE